MQALQFNHNFLQSNSLSTNPFNNYLNYNFNSLNYFPSDNLNLFTTWNSNFDSTYQSFNLPTLTSFSNHNTPFQPIPCPKQNGLSCAFHAIANANKMISNNGYQTMSHYDATLLDSHASNLENLYHSRGLCAGTNELSKYKSSGGIIIQTSELIPPPQFFTSINNLKNKTIKQFSAVLLFNSHAVALHFSLSPNNTINVKVADSDHNSLSLHPHTAKALNIIKPYL